MRATALVFLVLGALLPAVQAGAPLIPFHGQIETQEPLTAHGGLSVAGEFEVIWRPGQLPTAPIVSVPDLTLIVREERALLSPNPDGRTGGGSTLIDAEETLHRFEDARVTVERVKEGAGWMGLGRATTAGAWTSNVTCSVWNAGQAPTGDPSPPVGTSPPPRAMQAECLAVPVAMTGLFNLTIDETDVVVSGARHWVDGELSETNELRVETGITTQRITPIFGIETLRLLVIEWPHGGPPLAWDEPGHARFMALAVDLEGTLELPAGRGRLAWADEERVDAFDTWEPRGTFLVTSDGVQFQLDGRTTNEPFATEARQVPTVAWNPTLPVAATLGAAAIVALLVGFFTRVLEPAALKQERRNLVVELLRNQPGATIQDVARVLNIPRTSLRHHVAILVRLGLVVQRRFGGRTALFAAGATAPGEHAPLALQRRAHVLAIAEALRRDPTLTQGALARMLDISQSNVSRCLKMLVSHRIIEVSGTRQRPLYPVVTGPLPSGAPAAAPIA